MNDIVLGQRLNGLTPPTFTMDPAPTVDYDRLFREVITLIQEYCIKYSDRSSKVIEFRSPQELSKLIDLEVREEGVDTDTLLQLCRTALEHSVHTVHPHFFNQLFAAVDEVGLLGTFLSTLTNTSVYTYEMAPVFSLMEGELLHKMRELIGWPGGRGDGIFSPGGSISNLYALTVARYQRFPETKTRGTQHLPQMAVFTSEQAHYSVCKSAILMGLGTDSVISVACNKCGKMIPSDLDAKISEAKAKGLCPITVVATAGTTVLGAFDPLNEIADVCEKHSVWMHTDGAYGMSAVVSRTHRPRLLAGIERADSVAWCPHKALMAPLQCSVVLLRHEGLLAQCNSTKANYLFQQDKSLYDVSFDTGDKSFQCSRLNDALKLWLMWKAKGTHGFEKQMDRSIALSRYLVDRIRTREGFELVLEEPEYTSVPFWYIPPSLRNCSDPEERQQRLAKVAPMIKAGMMMAGTMMINYQPLGRLPNFFRMIVTNSPKLTESDMDFVLDEIERLGRDLVV